MTSPVSEDVMQATKEVFQEFFHSRNVLVSQSDFLASRNLRSLWKTQMQILSHLFTQVWILVWNLKYTFQQHMSS